LKFANSELSESLIKAERKAAEAELKAAKAKKALF
jgi:hypothetical protein